jgi:hypothetical protein
MEDKDLSDDVVRLLAIVKKHEALKKQVLEKISFLLKTKGK